MCFDPHHPSISNIPVFHVHIHNTRPHHFKLITTLRSCKPEQNMELKAKDHDQEQGPGVSVLQGDGICINRILARESSVGQSSRTFYRSAEGVPFRWEMQPGTPKNPQQVEHFIPPICPSPLMQSLGIPLPNLDCDDDNDDPASKTSKVWRLREVVKKRIKMNDILGRRSKQKESSTFSSPFSTTNRINADVSMDHAPFCCTPWNTPAILVMNSCLHFHLHHSCSTTLYWHIATSYH